MMSDKEREASKALGLAKAAVSLARENKRSALELAQEAVTLHADPLTLATYCKVSLHLYDVAHLVDAIEKATPHRRDNAALNSLVENLEAGPIAAIALADRLTTRQAPSAEPIAARILYVLHKSVPFASDGYAMRSHGLASALIRKGVDLICVTRPGYPFDLLQDQSDEMLQVIDEVAYHRITEPRRSDLPPKPSEHLTHASIDYLERSASAIVEQIEMHRPSCVISASNHATALPACLAAHECGLPFIYEVRGFWEFTRASRDDDYLKSVEGRQEVFLESATMRASEAVVTLTSAMKHEIIKRGIDEQRITVAPNGVNIETFVPASKNRALLESIGASKDTLIIGYVGTFNIYEGLIDLVEACASLTKDGFDFKLLLVGDEPADANGMLPVTAAIHAAAKQTGPDDWLVMPGRVPHEQVADWYSIIDITPFPRKSHLVTETVSPLKPLEALAMGKAVVVSSVGGMQGMVVDGQTGLVHVKDDCEALREALQSLLSDEALRKRLGLSGRKWTQKKRSWSMVADNVLEAVAATDGGRG